MSLSRLAQGGEIPMEIYYSRPMRSLENSAADFACFTNDIFSYQKEIEFEGEIHNCVLVVQNFLNCDTTQIPHPKLSQIKKSPKVVQTN
jgi:germacradienol/geosmin synthase